MGSVVDDVHVVEACVAFLSGGCGKAHGTVGEVCGEVVFGYSLSVLDWEEVCIGEVFLRGGYWLEFSQEDLVILWCGLVGFFIWGLGCLRLDSPVGVVVDFAAWVKRPA